MPTVPMYHRHPEPIDASHGVYAPGGYEWWRFEAEDDRGAIRVVADFFNGCPFHAGYVREYRRYLRQPTRRKPPLPENYPCVSFVVYETVRVIAAFSSVFPTGALKASANRLEIEAGENSVRREGGDIVIRIRGADGPSRARAKMTSRSRLPLSAELRFQLRRDLPPREQSFGP